MEITEKTIARVEGDFVRESMEYRITALKVFLSQLKTLTERAESDEVKKVIADRMQIYVESKIKEEVQLKMLDMVRKLMGIDGGI